MRWTIGRLFALALVVLGGGSALAAPITYTMTATATGTLAGTAFTNAAITVTSVADTSLVFVAGGVFPNLNYEVISFSSSINIAGFGTATFTDPMFWEDPNGAGDILFGDLATGNAILGFTHLFAGLETYNLESSFGPVSSPFDFVTSVFHNFANIPTTAGSLSLVASNDTFTAVAVPEPSPFGVTSLGLVGLLAIRRRSRDIR